MRILLGVVGHGPAHSALATVEFLQVSVATVDRVGRRFVEGGLEHVVRLLNHIAAACGGGQPVAARFLLIKEKTVVRNWSKHQ